MYDYTDWNAETPNTEYISNYDFYLWEYIGRYLLKYLKLQYRDLLFLHKLSSIFFHNILILNNLYINT